MIAAMASLALLAVIGLVCVLCYAVLRVLSRWERRQAEFDEVPKLPERVQEEVDRQVMTIIESARNSDQAMVDVWREQKRQEGWTDEDIEQFLAERPVLDVI